MNDIFSHLYEKIQMIVRQKLWAIYSNVSRVCQSLPGHVGVY